MPKTTKDKKISNMLKSLTIKEPEGERNSVGRRLPITPFPSVLELIGSSSDSLPQPKKTRIIRRPTTATLLKRGDDKQDYEAITDKDLYEFCAAKNRVMSKFVHPALPAVPSNNMRHSNE